MNWYAHDKTKELEAELKNRIYFEMPERPRRRTLVGGFVAATGRVLRRAGEGLESWSAAPSGECEQNLSRRLAR
jgi:hypothetical protein